MNIHKLHGILWDSLVSTQQPLWFYIMYNKNLMFHSGLNIAYQRAQPLDENNGHDQVL